MTSPSSQYANPIVRLLGVEVDTKAAVDLLLDDAGMTAKFLGGSSELRRGSQFNAAVQLEDGQFATLIDCVQLSVGQVGGTRESPWRTESTPNLVLLGREIWPADRKVRQLRYCFAEAETALHYGDHAPCEDHATPDNHISTMVPSHINAEKLVILRLRSNGYEVVCELQMSGSFSRLDPRLKFTPSIRIDSDEPRLIAEIHRFASQVLSFFELSLGARSRMFDIQISEHTQAEQERRYREEKPAYFFEMRLHYGDWKPPNVFLHPAYALFPVYDEAQRNHTTEALRSWLDRLPEWEGTYALASFYLGRTGPFDRDRLLRATAWFESLPSRDTASDVTADQVRAIVAAAQAGATDVGRSNLAERVSGLLSNLFHKSLKRQMLDLASSLRNRFGDAVVPLKLDERLKKAAELRSRASHGRLAFGDDDAHDVISSTRALELVCALATVADVVDAESISDRISGHYPLAGIVFGL